MKGEYLACGAMSEEQLAALLAKLKDDVGLQEKFKGAANLDAAIALAKESGFEVSKADWLNYHAKQTIELSDGELESVSGGFDTWYYYSKNWCSIGDCDDGSLDSVRSDNYIQQRNKYLSQR